MPAVAILARRIGAVGATASLVVALAAGCGSSARTNATATTAVAATTTSTVGVTTTTIDPDVAIARVALLTLSDLPTGWTASPSENSNDNSGPSNQQIAGQMASCLGVSAATLDSNPPEADSPTFTSPNQADTVDDEVQVFPTVAAAATDVALFDSTRTPGCFVKLFDGPLRSDFTQSLDPGQSLVSVSATAVAIGPVGDHQGDVRITFVIAQSGVDVRVFLDMIVVVKGRTETNLTITEPQVLALPRLGAELAGVAAARMAG